MVDFFLLASIHLTAPEKSYGCYCCRTCQQVKKNTFPKVLSPIKFAGNQAQSTKHFMRCCWVHTCMPSHATRCVDRYVCVLCLIVCYYNRYGERIKLKYSNNLHTADVTLCSSSSSVCTNWELLRIAFCIRMTTAMDQPILPAAKHNSNEHARIPFRLLRTFLLSVMNYAMHVRLNYSMGFEHSEHNVCNEKIRDSRKWSEKRNVALFLPFHIGCSRCNI